MHLKKCIASIIVLCLIATTLNLVKAQTYNATIIFEDENNTEKSVFGKDSSLYYKIYVEDENYKPLANQQIYISAWNHNILQYSIIGTTEGGTQSGWYRNSFSLSNLPSGEYIFNVVYNGEEIGNKTFFVFDIKVYKINWQTGEEEKANEFAPGQVLKISVFGRADYDTTLTIKKANQQTNILSINGKTDGNGFFNYTYNPKTIAEDKEMDALFLQFNITATIENSNTTAFILLKTASAINLNSLNFLPSETAEITARVFGYDYFPVDGADISVIVGKYTEGNHTVRVYYETENKSETMYYFMDKNAPYSTIDFKNGEAAFGGENGYFSIFSNTSQTVQLFISDYFVGEGFASTTFPAIILFSKENFFKKVSEMKNKTTTNGKYIYKFTIPSTDVKRDEYNVKLVRFNEVRNSTNFVVESISSIELEKTTYAQTETAKIKSKTLKNANLRLIANSYEIAEGNHILKIVHEGKTETMNYILTQTKYKEFNFVNGITESGGRTARVKVENSGNPTTFKFYVNGIKVEEKYIEKNSSAYFELKEEYFYKIIDSKDGNADDSGEFYWDFQIPSSLKDGTYAITLVRFDEIVQRVNFFVEKLILQINGKQNYVRGETATFYFSLRNRADENFVSANVDYKIYKDDNYKDMISEGSLIASAVLNSLAITIPSTAVLGAYKIELTAKYESYETTEEFSFNVIPLFVNILTEKDIYDKNSIVFINIESAPRSSIKLEILKFSNSDYRSYLSANLTTNEAGNTEYVFVVQDETRYLIKASARFIGETNYTTKVIEVKDLQDFVLELMAERGIFSPNDLAEIKYKLTDEEGKEVNAQIEWRIEELNLMGNFNAEKEGNISFKIPENFQGTLNLKVKAWNKNSEVVKTLPIKVSYLYLILNVDKQYYMPKDVIKVKYKLTKTINGEEIEGNIYYRVSYGNHILKEDAIGKSSSGEFSFSISDIAQDFYTITVFATYENYSTNSTIMIYKDNSIKLEIIFDKEQYKPGDTIVANYKIIRSDNSKFYSAEISYGLSWEGFVQHSFIADKTEGKFTIKIPDNLPEGNYYIAFTSEEDGKIATYGKGVIVATGYLGIPNFTEYDMLAFLFGIIAILVSLIALKRMKGYALVKTKKEIPKPIKKELKAEEKDIMKKEIKKELPKEEQIKSIEEKIQKRKEVVEEEMPRKKKIEEERELPKRKEIIEEEMPRKKKIEEKREIKEEKKHKKKIIYVACSRCSATIEIEDQQRPFEIFCPHCGTKGVIR